MSNNVLTFPVKGNRQPVKAQTDHLVELGLRKPCYLASSAYSRAHARNIEHADNAKLPRPGAKE